jgi:hypothetical protein
MTESMRVWVEIAFNISYLAVIWSIVSLMTIRRSQVPVDDARLALRFIWAFFALALGDTGHVGFRVIAYAIGGLDANPTLVGIGALSTAFTVTIFYMLMVDIWRLRYKTRLGLFGWFLLICGLIRMVVMTFPQNQWESVVAPYPWSLLRNAFLVVQGLGVMGLIFRDAIRSQDRTFIWVGLMIAVSYAFYTPVILWAAEYPILGMLMIPKTCAYIAVAAIALKSTFPMKGLASRT